MQSKFFLDRKTIDWHFPTQRSNKLYCYEYAVKAFKSYIILSFIYICIGIMMTYIASRYDCKVESNQIGELTEIAGGILTTGSSKNLLARARARRLLCIPAVG